MDKRCGKGEIRCEKGLIYKGMFRNDKIHGHGR